ncbi:ABC transporter substrate-binding protein [Fictibacillus fluitans]|uniref:ABC transporter substrate-binding protein n=1 Tax=Fictibacillus fluitans TaxID=3058422 RepID=A0ABT8HT90_9BACL|nr:ABC transporter substrate-binding protein [Fictibacillus sp. NE201]MDN4523994.1 ABC transporter substrate-binding protein [Fictibacillus sp. NE201]
MKVKSKVISIVSAALLLMGTAACSNDTASTDATKAKSSKGPVTFTYFGADPVPTWNNMQDEVGKEITKRTGVTLKASYQVGNDDKVGLIASSGQYPDLISPKGSAAKMVDAGAMVDLKPLIEKYAPNIKKLIGNNWGRLKYSNEDPKVYFIPTYDAVGQKQFDAGGGFELQHAAVKEAGYPQIKTLQDYENVIKQYVKKHPTVDGKPTVGMSLIGSDWHFLITVTNNATGATGKPDEGEYSIDPKTHKATFHSRLPEEKEYFKWLNHMNDIGLLDSQSFVQTYDQYLAKVASGRVVGLADQSWSYGSAENTLKGAGKDELTYGHYPVTLNDKYKRHDFQSIGFNAGWGIGITKNCKDPIRAIKFLDFLASDEGQILNYWGIKDKQYKVDNGKRVIPADVQEQKTKNNAEFTKKTGIGMYNISMRYGDGMKDSTGNYYTTNFPENVVKNYSKETKEVLSHYNAKTWKDLFPSEKEFPVLPWGAAWSINASSNTEYGAIFQKAEDTAKSYVTKAILAKPADFDKEWDNYLKALDAIGVKKMEAEYTKLVKARVELWSSK